MMFPFKKKKINTNFVCYIKIELVKSHKPKKQFVKTIDLINKIMAV